MCAAASGAGIYTHVLPWSSVLTKDILNTNYVHSLKLYYNKYSEIYIHKYIHNKYIYIHVT